MSARGTGYAAASVGLVSAAQLAMRWSMLRLPSLDTLPGGASFHPVALAVLLLGILGYAVSLLCWLGALANLPLNRAYSLLSLSYPLVYVGSALLPGLGGSINAGKTFGVALVVVGVVLINARRAPTGVTMPAGDPCQ